MSDLDESTREPQPASGSTQSIKFLQNKRSKSCRLYWVAAVTLVLALLYAWWYEAEFVPRHEHSAAAKGPVLTDHLWIDRLPQLETDTFRLYYFSGDDPVGLNDEALSAYKHVLEIFAFRAASGELTFKFPHDRRTATSAFAVDKLPKAKDDMDLRLTLAADPQDGGQPHVYFSSTKWSRLDRATWPARLRQLPHTSLELRLPPTR
jgi:hypothetical protein